ncbi:MAG: hypothetical protein K2H53_05375, partial [Clostridia bacterium]|nr:hypothetical protein [Clostridia bacterium]
VKNDKSLVKRDIFLDLYPLMCLGNHTLETEANLAWAKLHPKTFLLIKKYPSVKKYCSVLKHLIKQIDAELDGEGKIDCIAEKISQIKVSLPGGEADLELEEKIHKNAGAIARIIS